MGQQFDNLESVAGLRFILKEFPRTKSNVLPSRTLKLKITIPRTKFILPPDLLSSQIHSPRRKCENSQICEFSARARFLAEGEI